MAVALVVLCSTPGAEAQQNQNQNAPVFSAPVSSNGLNEFNKDPGKLFGSVQRNSGLRIDREKRQELLPDSRYQMDASQFEQPPLLPQVKEPLAGAVEAAPAPKKSSYVWNLSNMGGYYECTGQIKVVVPGDQLYKYGGKFIDGTDVPTTPVTTNFAGHVYRFPYVIKRQ